MAGTEVATGELVGAKGRGSLDVRVDAFVSLSPEFHGDDGTDEWVDNVVEELGTHTDDACMWYRHDFGLLSEEEKEQVRFMAREWLRAWGKCFALAS